MSGTTAIYEEDIWTYQDYLKLASDGKIYEIIGGNLFMTAVSTTKHQRVSRNLEMMIWDYVRKNKLGEVYNAPIDVIFDNLNVVQPDLIYISQKRARIIQERGIFGAPDLIIEILSPYNAGVDMKQKKRLYEHFAIREYWLVDPEEEKVTVYLMQGGKYEIKGVYLAPDTVECRQIKDLQIVLQEIFD